MLKEYLSTLANAIRSKLGTTEKINAQDFAEKIMSIPQGGADDFWDIYQDNGKRTDYNGAFAGIGWTDETFKPKYDIRPTTATNLFYYAKNIKNLKQILIDAGVVLDTSRCTVMNNFIQSADFITHLPEISTVSCASLSQFLHWNVVLTNVDKIILKSDGSQTFSNCFGGLNNLVEIRFEGKFGVTVSIKESTKLSKESIISIVNALYENSVNKKITFSKTAVNKAFGIDVDDLSTYPEGSEYYNLRHSKDNWDFAYA